MRLPLKYWMVIHVEIQGCVPDAPFFKNPNIITYMPEYHRSIVEGGTYFFTIVTYNRLPILISLGSKVRFRFLPHWAML
jgi:hypothetical protein